MRKGCLAIILFTSVLFGLTAQEDQAWYIDKPIADIQFKGLQHVDQNELDPIVKPFIGKNFSDSLFMDLQSKLYALNYFSRIQAEADSRTSAREKLVLIFTVEERPIIDEIVINGNNNVRNSEILDTILLKRDDILTKNKLSVDENAIKDLYLEKGFPNVEVSSKTEVDEEENTVKVIFSIEEGNQTRIRSIQFSGNTFASNDTLKKQLATKEQSFFHSGVFKQNQLEQDKTNIEEYYRQRGFIDAQVVEVERKVIDTEGNRNFLELTFFIEEGSQWTFGGIEFEGNKLFSDEELSNRVSLEEGETLNLNQLQQSFARISDMYYNDGYIYNDIRRQEQRDPENRTVSYTITIVEKGRAHIENILIKGNQKTKDKVIYREIPFETGDIFSKEKVITGMRNLYNTGLFADVAPETPYGSAEGLMDLVINVEEAKTTNINFGITFTGQAGEFPVIGFLRWNDNNFRGLGEQLSIGTELSGNRQNLNFGYNTNWLFGRRMSGGIDFDIEHTKNTDVRQDIQDQRFTKDEYDNSQAAPDPYDTYQEYQDALENGETIDDAYLMEYDEWEFSTGVSTGYTWHLNKGRLGTATGVRTGLSFIDYDEGLYRPYNPAVRENLNQWRFNNRWWSRAYWDTRDFIFAPSKGYYFGQTLTYGGGLLGGISHYIKSQTKAEFFHTLLDVPVLDNWNLKTVFVLHSSLSFILPQFYNDNGSWTQGVEASTSYLLYTDGMNIARGWPRKFNGQAMWDNWLEFRIPIAEQVLWSDLFFRSTGFWEDRSQFGLITDSPESYYFSYGGGIRFTIPNLPLGLYLTKLFKLDNEGNVLWEGGPIFSDPDDPESGWRLVLTINIDLM
ncbi:MAG: outer membrane protein assembly factor BamA [Spirochaetaceae bacterium]|nr:outer membrane protein assembly factor BamA [Spirochaetaceae bacterium]MCF7948448.1 outer membrane protein assembly factor BamA [Spirochaetia bacterium]MCF7950148.1 outer membrane protein assembly factor BamA [Spirochaetaceae bacterium]